jgi:hypothetical protein
VPKRTEPPGLTKATRGAHKRAERLELVPRLNGESTTERAGGEPLGWYENTPSRLVVKP